jgi:hypothetical protein
MHTVIFIKKLERYRLILKYFEKKYNFVVNYNEACCQWSIKNIC